MRWSLASLISKGNALGEPIAIAQAHERILGFVM